MLPLDGTKDGYFFLSKPMPNKVNGIAVPKRLLLYMQHSRCLWAYYHYELPPKEKKRSAMIYLFSFLPCFHLKMYLLHIKKIFSN